MKKLPVDIDPMLAKTILEQMSCAVITDREGRYLYANDAWADLMNLRYEDVHGKYVRDLVPETRIEEAMRQGVILTGTVPVSEYSRMALSIYLPIYDKQGRLTNGLILTILSGKGRDYVQKSQLLIEELQYYKAELSRIRGAKYSIRNIVGESPRLLMLKEAIRRAARSRSTVLIEGETGSGKELVAHAIHDLSVRSAEPFIKINCAGIPAELLESEFFGYEEGAFTGAKRKGQIGKFEQASGGSLFLDEINQLSLHLQPKLLRALQEKEIERLGGHKSIAVDVRLIACSNIPLEKLVRENRFREDLFYRLNVVTLAVPPLRQRPEDIPLLCDALVERLNQQMGVYMQPIPQDIKARLCQYQWPGNVRELQNVIERAMNMAGGDAFEWKHFASYFKHRHSEISYPAGRGRQTTIRQIKHEAERQAVQRAVEQCKTKSEAAKMLGISRTMLYKKLHQYGIGV